MVDAHPERQRRSSFRMSQGWRNRARGLVEVVVKRVDRVRNRARLRRLLQRYGSETALVFSHVSTKIAADETGWKRDGSGPLLVGQHHSQFESIDLEPWLRGAIADHFQDLDVFMALTEADAARFQEMLRPRCVAMPNPVEPSEVAPRTRRPTAVAISRLSGEKAVDVMVRCFAAATRDDALGDWQLDIYGEGDQLDVVRSAIHDSGCTRIRLAGHCDDPYEVLAEASVLLMTSWMEGLPMSILEAAVMGVPAIAFDCSPGVRSLVGEDRGYLVPPGDEGEFTRVLHSALQSPDELARRGEAARARAGEFLPGPVLEAWGRALTSCYELRDERCD
ncbi:glycosyltransferase [Nocardioides xinjiangensis]|uniref:glycosyltransferase n=1 Tax=Nocardioides xinjiangensis TaxID=2817376 RepID=UPI001B303DEB|nr:glycosyltransferase [Nocardioides sp. SYSU D00778]